MAVFFLTQGSTWTRTIFLSFIALIVFSIQTGLLRLPNPQIVPDGNHTPLIIAIQNIQNNPIDPPLQPQPEQPQNQELDPQLQQPRTLFGLISFVAYTFIASIMPDPIANPIPLD
ncbi:hypothetical protein BC833DRAFT_610393 [Globomyces pollinis-pini]|nr:hypothetical protein BC833DRAFT_612663 [Globomyces pollinis-pini]KAI8892871.1 hypothetical protein BC833DRAFT_610393 [Globomyces pollinis-pini]